MCKPYLRRVQEANVPEINQALNEVLVAEENVDELNESVDNFNNFNQSELAVRLEKHKLIDMRQIAMRLYYRTGKFEYAIELAKKDKLWKEAINAAAASEDPELIEQLAVFFLDKRMQEGFTATLYTCYEHFPIDVAMELAWTRGKVNHFMPFMIQAFEEVGKRLMRLQDERREEREREAEAKQAIEEDINDDPSVLLFGLSAPQMQTAPMLTYPGATPSGFMNAQGGHVPQIGWTNSAGQPMDATMYSTFGAGPSTEQMSMASQQAYATQTAYATVTQIL